MTVREHIIEHQSNLKSCRKCDDMIQPVVTGQPVASKILLVGQAPGDKEGVLGRPFAWTAGKTLFKWFASIGLEEETFIQNVYMAAVFRYFSYFDFSFAFTFLNTRKYLNPNRS